MSLGIKSANCISLYRFIRLVLGDSLSDREIARRWGMPWKSFARLKSGMRQMPSIDQLKRLAEVLNVESHFVYQVAEGAKAEEIFHLVETKKDAPLDFCFNAKLPATLTPQQILKNCPAIVLVYDQNYNLLFNSRRPKQVGQKCYSFFRGLDAPCPECGIESPCTVQEIILRGKRRLYYTQERMSRKGKAYKLDIRAKRIEEYDGSIYAVEIITRNRS